MTICLLFATVPIASSQTVPPMINYQGRLVNSNGVPLATGDYELRFRIWDAATNGNLLWGPQVFNGQSGPGYGSLVPVVQGYFNVILGPSDTNGLSISSAFSNTNRFIEIQVGANPPLSPRQQVLTAPYAFRASHADTASSVVGATTTGPLNLYVSTNGVDLNDGLTPATAKRSIQAAVNTIPNEVRHEVKIFLAPGTYFESVNIFNKIGGAYDSIAIEGVVTNPALVRIDGFVEGGGLRPFAFQIKRSGLSIYGVTFTNQSQVAVSAVDGSNIGMVSCNLDVIGGLSMERYSNGNCYHCIFRSPGGPGSGTGIECERFSSLEIREDVPNNSIIGYAVGIRIINNSIVRGSPVFSGNTTDVVEATGGRHY